MLVRVVFAMFRRLPVAWVLLAWLVASPARANEFGELNSLLDLDRFETYVKRWESTMRARGKGDLADAIKALDAPRIASLKLPAKDLADAFAYDTLIFQILKKERPELRVKREDVSWNYDFYKRKLNEAYVVKKSGDRSPALLSSASDPGVTPSTRSLTADLASLPAAEDVALNVDAYVSDRTTRAVFWEASRSGRPIEYHVGSKRDFLENMQSRGARVLGEVKSRARNYNPIYVIQVPGENGYRYAVSEISGADRLEHLAAQSALVRWKTPDGELASIPPAEVFGDPAEKLRDEERALTKILETAPKADRVVIGQKGAFENTFEAMSKRRTVLALMSDHGPELMKLLKPEQRRFLDRVVAAKDDSVAATLKNAKAWEDIFEAATPVMSKHKIPVARDFTDFSVDRGSYEFSDYILQGPDAKPQRWRVFSNAWGDEVLPVARALKATGHNDIAYIGTAGALPGSGLAVGDLAVPSKSIDRAGVSRKLEAQKIPEGAKAGLTVAHVGSPFEETQDWLRAQAGVSHAVEVETAYLARVFNGPKDKVKPYLLISDVVGSAEETLAEASSSKRRAAQIRALSAVLEEGGASATASVHRLDSEKNSLSAWIEELAPTRDPASRFQVERKAHAAGVTSKSALKKMLAEEASFTTARLEKNLRDLEDKLAFLLEDVSEKGVSAKLHLSKEFLEGRWNPAKDPLDVMLSVSSQRAELELQSVLENLRHKDASLEKLMRVKVARGPPPDSFIRVPGNSASVGEIYRNSALRLGGLATVENRSGALKFVRVARSPGASAVLGPLAYFPPDPETAKLLENLASSAAPGAQLKSEIQAMNALVSKNRPYEIRMDVVDSITGGNLAQIAPKLERERLVVELKITREGLKNPAVVMEELLHLQQITGAPLPWESRKSFKTFVHPYHWAETVANARAGSAQAREKLARVELEAARAAEFAVKHYKRQGLFASSDPKMIDDYIDARLGQTETLYADVAKQARADMKTRQAAWERTKGVFDRLEANKEKLNDLVARNDRKGVRKLVTQYLPWSLMEPSETKAWQEWLEALEKPDASKKHLVFRGMYDDTVMKNAQDVPYLMSTVLTRNQGNYTRRLRSLSTLRDKFGSEALRDSFSAYNMAKKNPANISVLMANHAVEAKGSPFLSMASYDVATKFGPRQLGAFMIDERRLVPNTLAPDKYLYQKEKLVPLVVFPDEVVHFHDYARNPVEGVGPRDPKARRIHFLGAVESKLGRKLSSDEISGTGADRDFVRENFERLQKLLLTPETLPAPASPAPGAKKCSTCRCLWGALNM